MTIGPTCMYKTLFYTFYNLQEATLPRFLTFISTPTEQKISVFPPHSYEKGLYLFNFVGSLNPNISKSMQIEIEVRIRNQYIISKGPP